MMRGQKNIKSREVSLVACFKFLSLLSSGKSEEYCEYNLGWPLS